MTLLVGSIFHMTRKIVSEMTYNVSMGTLNPTIPYHTSTELELETSNSGYYAIETKDRVAYSKAISDLTLNSDSMNSVNLVKRTF